MTGVENRERTRDLHIEPGVTHAFKDQRGTWDSALHGQCPTPTTLAARTGHRNGQIVNGHGRLADREARDDSQSPPLFDVSTAGSREQPRWTRGIVIGLDEPLKPRRGNAPVHSTYRALRIPWFFPIWITEGDG